MSDEPGHLQRVPSVIAPPELEQQSRSAGFRLVAWLPVHSARGLEEFVSALEFLRENDPLTPAALARIAWLFESDKREWRRLVCVFYPQESELQAAAEAIPSVPDDCWPESFAGWERAASPRDILEIEHQIITGNPDTREKHIHRFTRREEALAVAYSERELERAMQRERARQQAQALQAEQEVQRLQGEYAQERAKEEQIATLQAQVKQLQSMDVQALTPVIAKAAQQALGTLLPQHTLPPEPARKRRISDVDRFSQRVGMDPDEVRRRCRDGSILAFQGNGPGGKWRISPEEEERYLREGPREPTRQRRRQRV